MYIYFTVCFLFPTLINLYLKRSFSIWRSSCQNPTFPISVNLSLCLGDVTGQEGETGSSASVRPSYQQTCVPTRFGGMKFTCVLQTASREFSWNLNDFFSVALLNFPYCCFRHDVTPCTFIAQVPSVAMFERQVRASRCWEIRNSEGWERQILWDQKRVPPVLDSMFLEYFLYLFGVSATDVSL